MDIRRGDVYYNQEIPADELWGDTLKRNGIKFCLIGRVTEGDKIVVVKEYDGQLKETVTRIHLKELYKYVSKRYIVKNK